MAANSERADVLIIGGGMVGLALASALKEQPLRVVVIERGETPPRLSLGRDCRVSAIVAGSADVLRGLGLWEHLEAQAGPIMTMRIWDDQHFGAICFEAEEVGLGTLGYIIENSKLVEALKDVIEDAEQVEICCPAEVVRLDRQVDSVGVTLDDGRAFHAPLIVGADGGRSWLRHESGIRVLSHDYHQDAIVATVRPQFSHRGHALQRFLPTGPLAFLPLTDDLCSIVWSAESGKAHELMAMDDGVFLEALNLAMGPVLGRIEVAGERALFPLRAQHAAHVVRPRLALVGDAAHVIHPLAGLGVNLGLRDAMVLAQEIADARRFDEDIGSMEVLSRYAKLRLPDNLSVLAGMEAFHQMFTHNFPPLKFLRSAGMLAVGNSGMIKQQLMRTAMGLSVPVPKQII